MAAPAKTSDAEAAVAAAEKALYRAMIDIDLQALRDLLAADLAYVHSNGVLESRSRYMVQVKNRFYDYERIRSRRVRTTVAGSLAVMRGLLDMTVATGGGPAETIHLHFTLVWRRSGRRWQLMLRQATRIP